MKRALIVVLCAVLVLADGGLLKSKARLLGRLAGKHHKRGIISGVPTYKLGHDIPHVTHSLLKPFVVTYPPTAAVAAVKVPFSPPGHHHYHVPHKVPVSHPHFGLKFPHHHHTKTYGLPKPDQHFHHHHHHVSPRPVVPVVPTVPVPAPPIVPVAEPSGTVIRPLPAPSPPVLVPSPPLLARPAPVFPAQVVPLGPPPAPVFPAHHAHITPLLPAAQLPLHPTPFAHAPVYPVAPQYVIRPGNAIQTSVFANYPRYPYFNFQQLYPLTAPAAPAPVFLDRPAQVPHFHLGHEAIPQHAPAVPVEPTPAVLHPTEAVFPQPTVHLHPTQAAFPQPTVHLHPTQAAFPQPTVHFSSTQAIFPQSPVHLHPTPEAIPQGAAHLHPTQETLQQPSIHLHPTQAVPLDHDGWAPVAGHHHDLVPTHTEAHFPQHHEGQFTQEQGTQVFEHHTDEHHDYQHQLHHIQQQIDQAQYEQHLNNQHQLNQDYGAPHQNQDYNDHNHDYSQHHDFGSNGNEYQLHQQQVHQEYGLPQQQVGEEYGVPQQQINQEYGLQQQVEGRSSSEAEGEDSQRYHNHIPLGLQPPIDRPLEHFR